MYFKKKVFTYKYHKNLGATNKPKFNRPKKPLESPKIYGFRQLD
jgi:hypothetical protein